MTYSRVWDAAPGSANRVRPVQNEFDLISTYLAEQTVDLAEDFAAVYAAIALKANLAGPTFTGTATFSGSIVVPTMSVGDNSTNAASTAYVLAAVGASGSLLPPQTGNAGKFLTTDGSSASWSEVAELTWDGITGKPTTIAGFGLTNAQHAIEFMQDGQPKAVAPWRINFKNLKVTATADTLTVETPAFPHNLLLAQGII